MPVTIRNTATNKAVMVIDANSSEERLAAAAEALATGTGTIFLEGLVAFRRSGGRLYCEVVDPMSSARRCGTEFEVLVENAQRRLDASGFKERLPDLPRKWLVVEDCGTGTAVLWQAP